MWQSEDLGREKPFYLLFIEPQFEYDHPDADFCLFKYLPNKKVIFTMFVYYTADLNAKTNTEYLGRFDTCTFALFTQNNMIFFSSVFQF